MIQKINKTEAIKAKMEEEGNIVYLDKPEHMDAIVSMNENLEEIRREYQVKDRNSQISAANVILTA